MRLRRDRGQSLVRLVPNALTLVALTVGMTAVRYALKGNWHAAGVAVLVAALFDFLDGRMARFLDATSDFGAVLDSLSDFVAFGFSPGLVMYLWVLHKSDQLGWAVSLFFVACCALRLARFTTSFPRYAFNYFQGVPAPGGAGLCLLPLFFWLQWPSPLFLNPVFVSLWVVFIGLLMVSSIPTLSLKNLRVSTRWALPLLAVMVAVTTLLVGYTWITLSLLLSAYLVSVPFSWWQFLVLKRKAERLKKERASQVPYAS